MREEALRLVDDVEMFRSRVDLSGDSVVLAREIQKSARTSTLRDDMAEPVERRASFVDGRTALGCC